MGTTGPGHELFVPDPTITDDQRRSLSSATPPAASYNRKLDVEGEPEQKRSEDQRVKDFIQEAITRFKIASEAETELRAEAIDDQKFRVGDQWPFELKSRRDQDGRPTLTVNRLPQFLHQVTNEQRQNRPGIMVSPVGDQANIETAEILEGIIRHIEDNDGGVAYDTAFDYAACTGGPGWIRVLVRFVADDSFDQEIVLDRVLNPMTIYADPAFKDPAGRDLKWAFVCEDLTPEEYKEQFPNSQLSSFPDYAAVGDHDAGWITRKSIRVVEYWYLEAEPATLVKYADGTTEVVPGDVSETIKPENSTYADARLTGLEDLQPPTPEEEEKANGWQPRGPIVDSRPTKINKVKWAKLNALEILDQRDDYPGHYIPLIPVLGDECVVDGKRYLAGIVRFAKDAQRAYNYWTSAETEMIALAPKAPFIMEAGQIEGFEDMWRGLNTKNYATLIYKGVTIGDKPAPPPERNSVEAPVQAIVGARAQAADDLKATTGIYDASLGAQGNERSGKAILARQHEGDVANFHLSDNLTRSIRQVGRVILDLIPSTYTDEPRIQRILGREQNQRIVSVVSAPGGNVIPDIQTTNQVNPAAPGLPPDFQAPGMPPQAPPPSPSPIQKIYNVGVGKYDVVISVGPSFATKRQEAAESMMQLTNNYPAIMEVAGDLLVKNLDWPGAQQIAARLKKQLPPNLQDEADENGNPVQGPTVPQLQAQVTQLNQQLAQMTQISNELLEERKNKVLELSVKERIATMQTQASLLTAEAKLQSDRAIADLRHGIDLINARLEALKLFEAQQGLASEEAGIPSQIPGAVTGNFPGAPGSAPQPGVSQPGAAGSPPASPALSAVPGGVELPIPLGLLPGLTGNQ